MTCLRLVGRPLLEFPPFSSTYILQESLFLKLLPVFIPPLLDGLLANGYTRMKFTFKNDINNKMHQLLL
ncbi:hypothetical protein Y1Q_0008967 [Alligator mississippiensis]|uniref:Uncharacterized protein n=1 Tax=Alligator mississippiensis TaxID=8496 RepID=A0A151NKI8_ALLMI|nr:hypothetical protein Y1Q_0008967 [Alligator mississippiensis]